MNAKHLTPTLSILVGVFILIFPSSLAYAVALYFIVTGVIQLASKR